MSAENNERTGGLVSRLTAAFRRSDGGENASVSITEEEELDLHALVTVGGTDHLSPQDVVDEIHSAAEAEAGASDEQQYGRVGRPFNRRSP